MKPSTSRKIVNGLLVCAALWGLWQCAPGFRPKHLRDITIGFFTVRGIGMAALFGLTLAFAPAAARLKKDGFTASVLGGVFLCFAALLCVHAVLTLGFGLESAGAWAMRAAAAAIVFWGTRELAPFRRIAPWNKLRGFWRELSVPWKVLMGLVLFFFARQELSLFFGRGGPFEDETFFWHSASVVILKQGFLEMVHFRNYTPGVPWLITLPARLLGVESEPWIFAYPFFIFCCLSWIVFETAAHARAWVAGTIAIFYVFLSHRDLLHLYGSSLYGEGISSVLVALVVRDVYSLWPARGKPRLTRANVVGFAALLSFAMLSKPPISSLALLVLTPVALGSALLFSATRLPDRAVNTALTLVAALAPYLAWRHRLTVLDSKPEYSFTLSELIKKGVDLSIPWGMFKGLSYVGSPQFAYTSGLVLAVVVAWLAGGRRYLAFVAGTILVYWGFVFSLYATLWQHMETYSAGRYISHAAIACVVLLPLAFANEKSRQF